MGAHRKVRAFSMVAVPRWLFCGAFSALPMENNILPDRAMPVAPLCHRLTPADVLALPCLADLRAFAALRDE